jgi:hypothetical protein
MDDEDGSTYLGLLNIGARFDRASVLAVGWLENCFGGFALPGPNLLVDAEGVRV